LAKKRKRRRRAAPRQAASANADAAARPGAAAKRSTGAARRRDAEGPPPAPWGSFPLVELVIFVGIVMLVVGFVAGGGTGTILIVVGLVLAALGGLELSVREHFSGYRSHTTLLAGLAAVACLAILFFGAPTALAPAVRIGIAAVVFGLAAWGLTAVFRRASGGLAFRIRGFRG
jgi:hypothetical protein